MTTLIRVGNSEGEIGRCDAKCHNAHHPHCNCVCGGKLHGVGVEQARNVATEMVEALIKGTDDTLKRERDRLTLQHGLPLGSTTLRIDPTLFFHE